MLVHPDSPDDKIDGTFADCCDEGIEFGDEELKRACALVSTNIVEFHYNESTGCLSLVKQQSDNMFVAEFIVSNDRCCAESTGSDDPLALACPVVTAIYNYSPNLGECFKIESVSGVNTENVVDKAECCQASNGNDNLALACPVDLAGLDEPCETFNQGLNAYNPDCESPLVCQSFDPAEPNGDKYCVDPASVVTLAGLDEPCETFNQGLNDYNPDCVSSLVC
jgi:hypothetical protein